MPDAQALSEVNEVEMPQEIKKNDTTKTVN